MAQTNLEITPGLYHLDLNINATSDMETLKYIMCAREKYRNTEPTPSVFNILDCLLALIDKQLSRRKYQSIKKLETILEKDPYHLNALAELEILYKLLFRTSHAKACREKIKTVLSTNDNHSTRQKAICLLEQGYSILFDEMESCILGIASSKSQELYNLIGVEYKNGNSSRKRILKDSLFHSKNISMKLERLKNLPKECDETKYKFKIAVDLLQRGLQILKADASELEIAEWQYYLAIAHYRLEKCLSEVNQHSIQIFIEALTTLEQGETTERKRFYIARCYAYIGYIYSTRQNVMTNYEGILTSEQMAKYGEILSKPEEAFKKALVISPCDIHVLNRYAMFLYQQSKQSYHLKDLSILQTAKNYLKKSVKLSPDFNWLAYSTRISLCLFWSRVLPGGDKNDTTVEYLLNRAVKDGKKCLETKITENNCIDVAKACQSLAKHPMNGKYYGPEYVKNKDYLYQALAFLHHALHLQGASNYSTSWTLGSCLYELQEYREAIEWMKRAMYLSHKGKMFSSLKNVCLYICDLYKQYENKDENRYLLEELLFVLQYAISISTSDDLVENVCKILQQSIFFENFIEFICDSTYHKDHAHLILAKRIASAIDPDVKSGLSRKISDAEKSSENADSDNFKTENLNLEDIFQRPFTSVPRIDEVEIDVGKDSNDSGWVKTFLLRQLEFSFGDQDRKLRGCIDERDFVPGKSIIDNIIYAIKNSKRIILILSPSYIKSNWCSYELDHSLMQALDEQVQKQKVFLIPLMIEKCEVPEKIGHLNFGDLTDVSKVFGKLDQVKHELMDLDI